MTGTAHNSVARRAAARLYGAVRRRTFYGTIPAMPLLLPDPAAIRCVIFDFGGTLSSDFYFNVNPPDRPDWFSTIQRRLFADQPLVDRWMRQELALEDIAEVLAPEMGMSVVEVVHWAVLGCQRVKMNPVVWQFAEQMKATGRSIAIVTGNMDVFNRYIRPNQGLDDLFPVIINSCDYGELDKTILWPLAFQALGPEIDYHNSLLIEDSPNNVARFVASAGFAYQYTDDAALKQWLVMNHLWDSISEEQSQ